MKMQSTLIFQAVATEIIAPMVLFSKALGLVALYGQHSNCAVQINNVIIPIEYGDNEKTLMSKYKKILEDMK
jgi:hypothetical protein